MGNLDLEGGEAGEGGQGKYDNHFVEDYKEVMYSDFVTDDKTGLKRLLAKMDYYDQLYSRKLQLMDNNLLNVVLGIGSFIINKFYVLIQFPIIMAVTYKRPEILISCLDS